jgi:nucleotide-binding universal stress UspA family protein
VLPFKRILFPVDFSDHSVGAARYVETFAGRFDADLTMLHVDWPQYNDPLPSGSKVDQLNGFLAKEFEYFRVRRIIVKGEPATVILDVARTEHSDLIMMPTLGMGAFRRFLLGSVTAKVLHDADCPVWTGVHLENAPPLEKIEIHNIVCAINLDNHARLVLKGASELADEYRAGLTVIHVTPDSHGAAPLEEMLRSMKIKASIVAEPGEVSQVVAGVAARVHADLLVIGRSPDPGMFGRLRTHAYPIIRQSPCPVISL